MEKNGYYCENRISTKWENLAEAKRECSGIPDCGVIQDKCGRGEFYYCSKDAPIVISACGSIINTRGIVIKVFIFIF